MRGFFFAGAVSEVLLFRLAPPPPPLLLEDGFGLALAILAVAEVAFLALAVVVVSFVGVVTVVGLGGMVLVLVLVRLNTVLAAMRRLRRFTESADLEVVGVCCWDGGTNPVPGLAEKLVAGATFAGAAGEGATAGGGGGGLVASSG